MIDQDIERRLDALVRPELRALSAYHVPEAKGLIKLDAMENPYHWPEALKEEWLQRLSGAEVNRYPHPGSPDLKQQLRKAMAIPKDAGVLLGNGSDELIQMIAMMLGGSGRTILSVDPSFVVYKMIAALLGMQYHGVPLRADDFTLDLSVCLQAIEQTQPAIIFLAYPNNPTGNLFSNDDLVQIIKAAPGVVVIDEAYAPFTDSSFLDQVMLHSNLLVMRTVSKMGLAGLRLGYLVGAQAWLTEIDKARMPYNINVLTQLSVAFALEHVAVFEEQTRRIRKNREALFAELQMIDGIKAYPSDANFILTRMPSGRATEIHQGMKERGVLVKNLHGSHGALADCLRLTIGSDEENIAQLAALKGAL